MTFSSQSNKPKLEPGVLEPICNERGRKILTGRCFERAFQTDLFRFSPLTISRETILEHVKMKLLPAATAPRVIQSCREMTRAIFKEISLVRKGADLQTVVNLAQHFLN